jgi:hypothetical protein
MIGHTEAFKTYRTLSQSHLDFVVTVCHAVPALRADLALPNPQVTNPPDHFKASANPKSFVAKIVDAYPDELARTTLITVFSYFEAYVKDALIETVEFHGGQQAIKRIAKKQSE